MILEFIPALCRRWLRTAIALYCQVALTRLSSRARLFGLKIPQLLPTLILLVLGWIGIFFALQPKVEPVNVAIVDRQSMFRLMLGVQLMMINPHLDRYMPITQLPEQL